LNQFQAYFIQSSNTNHLQASTWPKLSINT